MMRCDAMRYDTMGQGQLHKPQTVSQYRIPLPCCVKRASSYPKSYSLGLSLATICADTCLRWILPVAVLGMASTR